MQSLRVLKVTYRGKVDSILVQPEPRLFRGTCGKCEPNRKKKKKGPQSHYRQKIKSCKEGERERKKKNACHPIVCTCLVPAPVAMHPLPLDGLF